MHWKRGSLLINGAGKIGYILAKEQKLQFYLSPLSKISSKWIKMRCGNFWTIRRKHGKELRILGKNFVNKTPKTQETIAK